MIAPYRGILVWVGKPNAGTSLQGTDFKVVQFAIKYLDWQMKEQYMVFTISGTQRVDRFLKIPINTEITVCWKPHARKWVDPNGEIKWFATFAAFAVKVVSKNDRSPYFKENEGVQEELPTDDIPL